MNSSPQAKLFDEVRGTKWSAYQVRFSYESKHDGASIDLAGRGGVAFISGAERHRAALMRAGYVVRGADAYRPLRNAGEVRAERDLLTSFVRTSMMEEPQRRVRQILRSGKRSVSGDLVTMMRRTSWSWVATLLGRGGQPTFVDANGWGAYAWCFVVDDDGPRFVTGLQIYSKKKPKAMTREQVKRALGQALRPQGYGAVSGPGSGTFFLAEKTLRSLPEARRERAWLDGLLR